MLYGDRNDMRQVFVDTYRKARARESLTPMEQLIAGVIADHPEYHQLLASGDIEGDFTVEQGRTNPFLHMAMHISIREQVSVDRPAGIRAAWQQLSLRAAGQHGAEHRMLDCLAEMLLQAQRNGAPPDSDGYLQAVRRLVEL